MECFCVMSEEIERRIDPHFYRPEFIELEKKVSKKTDKKLGDFIVSISGGATPSRQQDAELYSDEESGIPFLRVQNITEEGLVLDDVKYITKEVHEGQLKRSQVKEDNLLITITGRIASSCVVPKGFEGNINQHSVVIKTKDRKTAEIIASFLNSSIGHKLAIRRTSGGSRLALDYVALKSIPIILNEKIVSLMNNAYKEQKKKEEKTSEFLDSINDYVLDELVIKLPQLEDKIIYIVSSEEVQNKRIDAYYFQPKFEDVEKAINEGKFEVKEIGKGLIVSNKLENIENYDFINYVDLSSINKNLGLIKSYEKLEIAEAPSRARQKLEKGDLLLSSLVGSLKSIAIFEGNFDNAICSTWFYVIKNSKDYNNYYLYALFRGDILQMLLQRESSGAIMSAINRDALSKLKIPLPPITIQNKIADEVKKRIQKAETLQKEAKEELKKAKLEVEKIILGD